MSAVIPQPILDALTKAQGSLTTATASAGASASASAALQALQQQQVTDLMAARALVTSTSTQAQTDAVQLAADLAALEAVEASYFTVTVGGQPPTQPDPPPVAS